MFPRRQLWSLIALVLAGSVLWAIPYGMAASPVADGVVTSIGAPTQPPHAPSDFDESVPTMDWAAPLQGMLLVAPPPRTQAVPQVRFVGERGFPDSLDHPPRDPS